MTKENGVVKVFSKWKMIVTTIGAAIGVIVAIFNIMLADYPTNSEMDSAIKEDNELRIAPLLERINSQDEAIEKTYNIVMKIWDKMQ